MRYSEIANEALYKQFLIERGRNVAKALAERRGRGEAAGAAPLGLKIHTDPLGTKRYAVDPGEWPLVRESILRYRKGDGLRPLLAEMTGRGLRSRKGNVLSPSVFLYMVKNGAYARFM